MPDPSEFATEAEFMAACIPEVLDDGTAESQVQAVAVCMSMWESRSMSEATETQERAQSLDLARMCDLEITRASVDAEAGTFEAAVFTGGEASDGHLLNVRGADLSEQRIPLFENHFASPSEQLGSLTNPRRDGDAIVYQAHIELDGPRSEKRRDLMHMVATGHTHRLSGRWDSEERHVTRRVNLPKTHKAFIDSSDEAAGRKRYGLYFDRWRPLEGSLVGLGADGDAQIRAFKHGQRVIEAFRDFPVEELVECQLQDGRTYFVPPELLARMEVDQGEATADDPVDEPPGNDSQNVTIQLTPPQAAALRTFLKASKLEAEERAQGKMSVLRQLLESPRVQRTLRTDRARTLFRDTLRRDYGIVLPGRD